jgi:hypothetical protein
MTQEAIDYEAVIADLEAKRTTIDTAITSLRAAMMAANQGGASVAAKPIDPASIPDDTFFGLSIGEAAKKYLTIVKRKQSVKEIADALDRGGLPHTSVNFVNTVSTMMNRAGADPASGLVRVGRGEWGLAAWYGSRRPKPEPVKKSKRKPQERKSEKSKSPAPGGGATRGLVEKALRESGKPLHIDEILKRIHEGSGQQLKKDTVASMLSVAVRNNDTFSKVSPGVFGLL